ncbi:GntR family transcriptional regulator [Amycolatopsis sp. H20-H5]|uniref:GntR family transcriptional regulator n=1 Tax=Amycolatopsis sp. H20-H5 TaxID=3046309 RepID=UPI002DBD2AD4|nr:GntR family transcriptional regulator [Amycolatopsis sp. H20-H5]MEC3981136.1 GntR family transcriptional regulator [Amycolatopsis sp. H20-H5]
MTGRDKAYEYLKTTVLTDPGVQGEFLSEQEIADSVGVSRTPVREALLMLAAEGLVQLVPKRGAYIAPLTSKELRELVELRGVLERFAAEKALADGTVPVAEMRAALEAQARLASPERAKDFIDLDAQFHSLLIASTGNAMLIRTYTGLRDRQIRAGLVALFSTPRRQAAVLREHQAIVDALAAGDLPATLAAIDDHLGTTLNLQLTN